MVVPPQQQMEYSSLIPNYSAPSSVCTSDSGGGGSAQGRMRTIRLHRRLVSNHSGPPNFGFSVRGGREHGTGFFVSAVEQGSEAHCQGLRIGDQIVRINGYSVVDAIHREVLRYIKSQNHLELRVRTVGMIPVKDKRTDPLTWRVVEDDRLHSPQQLCAPVCNGNSDDVIRDVRLLLNVAPRTKLGCGICKGPEWKPGIFVQFTKENGLAREAGLRPGDQILQCNGVPFIDIPFSDAVNVLKTSRQLDLIIRKGAGLDLFPGESSGYNSSASSVNGDQSPNWGDTKRLSIVKEESVELEERLGQLDSNHRINDKHHNWDQIEQEWEKKEPKERRKTSPVLRVHFEENGNDHNMDETNRDMSELSMVSSGRNSVAGMDGQHTEQKNAESAKLAEIRMVSQQLETKTVVVEVHRSEEVDESTSVSPITSQRLGSEDETKHNSLAKSPSSGSFVSIGSSSAGSSLSSAISQELQRRSKRRESEGFREVEKKKDILKAIDGEKRQQHEQLMDEFKRVHRKMFAHNVAAENQNSTCCHTEASQLKISHSLEERESFQVKRLQKDDKEEKVSHQKTIIATKEHSIRDQQGVSDVREVTILTRKTTAPPPPPPMPSETDSSGSWKPSSPASSLASSGKISLNGRPPSCPTPDYDTSSSSSISSPSASLIIVNKTSPHHSSPVKSPAGHTTTIYSNVNKNAKQLLNPQSRAQTTNPTKNSTSTSQNASKNADSVEMQSIESFTLTNPQSPQPRPPETYFVPLRNKKKPQPPSANDQSRGADRAKQRPVSITIGEYPSGVERRVPTRFDFLQTHNSDGKKSTSQTDGSNISCQLQSELAQTLSRSNLRKQTDFQEPHHNGILKGTSAKGTVTISVNCQPPVKNNTNALSRPLLTNGANKIHIESNNNSRSKISIVSTENKPQTSSTIKPVIRNNTDKTAKSLGTSNRVTISVPNGVKSNE